MEDQLITSGTAKLAKEKRFDWEVNQNFLEADNGEYYPDYGDGDSEMMILNHNAYDKIYSRPTQSLLQRWLREVHAIHFTLHTGCFPESKERFWTISMYIHHWSTVGTVYKSYENALEIGLQEALKFLNGNSVMTSL
jgi:hypothetical protein